MIPVTNSAYKLFHEGQIALSEVEANGIRIDTDYFQRAIKKTGNQIIELTNKLKQDKIFKVWKRRYGIKTNLGSRKQLGKILFKEMKFDCKSHTSTGRPQADKNALENIKIEFVKTFLEVESLKKAKSTYLEGILRETVDGYLHPFFNLNAVRTYRGSSNSPNFQNIPIKNPKIGRLIRQGFIARKNYQLVETDFSGIEVHTAAWYNKDPVMLDYISNPKKDMHRDMAQQCYMLSKEEMKPSDDKRDIKRIKDIRYCGKNMFIFPQFYCDYYIHCAKSLWEAIGKMHLTTRDGLSLRKHLKRKDITWLGNLDPEQKPKKGSFEKHIQEVEYDFWNNRFKIYNQWRKDWYEAYKKTGKFVSLSGFVYEGFFNRKEVVNYPIQGTAFHCLLWSLIKIQKLLHKYKMKTLIVGQIHDSIVSDVHRKEVENYLEIVQQVMTIDIVKHWPWIITPINISSAISPVNGNWYQVE